ncbi:hypothetical protein G7046_g9606 [Stylonectria norvegica]|nr:hypothetical protein G7046_g9606 [Stylonectria norvegica]
MSKRTENENPTSSIDARRSFILIKRAYRKKALELHPDRNINNVETATRKFAEIQAAYEILSDPQERAWYDSHRDAILSGQDGDDLAQPATFRNVRLTSAEEIMGLMRKFNATIPFDDEPTGFFGVARETFEHLALEEEAAAEFGDIDSQDYPTFGSSDDNYDSVVKSFYTSWAGFSTNKSFSWKDKYRLSEAPDRRVRRLMEKENKKMRDDAVREFNDAVRFLVGFVRKRDPRYLPNSQTDAERQASLRNAAAAQAARSRATNQEKLASHQVPEWARPNSDDGLGDHHFSESDEDSEIEIIECVVCNKTFKSEKQFEAHEKSKKHTKAVHQLRRQMKREGTELKLDEVDPTLSQGSHHSVTPGTRHKDTDSVEQQADKEERPPTPPSPVGISHVVAPLGSTEASSDGDDYAPRDVVRDRLLSNGADSVRAPGETGTDSELSFSTKELSLDEPPQRKKIGKAKAKRERKAAAWGQQEDVHECSVCGEICASRTKLFNHIRDNGHAALVQQQGTGSQKKKR